MARYSIDVTTMEDNTRPGGVYIEARGKVYHVRYDGVSDGFEKAKSLAKGSLEYIFDNSGSLPKRVIIDIE